MTSKPHFGLRVLNLPRSIHFYRDQIGLQVETDIDVPNSAILTTAQQQHFLIAGPHAPDWSEMLAEGYTILKPGEKIFMGDPEFEQRLARLAANGEVEFELIERPWGDRMIEVEDLDGFGVSLWELCDRSYDEILELLLQARSGFRATTTDMSLDQQRWRPGPEEWSAREVVHHVADSSLTTLHAARVALAEPGTTYLSNPYDQRRYANELRYQERDIEPSLQFIESSHDMLCSLIESIPDSWERSITTPQGGETNVETFLLMLAQHNLEHIEQIRDIRRALQLSPHLDGTGFA